MLMIKYASIFKLTFGTVSYEVLEICPPPTSPDTERPSNNSHHFDHDLNNSSTVGIFPGMQLMLRRAAVL